MLHISWSACTAFMLLGNRHREDVLRVRKQTPRASLSQLCGAFVEGSPRKMLLKLRISQESSYTIHVEESLRQARHSMILTRVRCRSGKPVTDAVR
ncbi:hypothetical protein E2C01_056221 [Portunus trituberculatus]|uniref:Uncharacterized protein n=1 Tax=Portunus trituberculatus TaxID=210409 RepID=A0A5B7GZ07_PORTR|nr:hypothetical protein [Portunus trituberculatus]